MQSIRLFKGATTKGAFQATRSRYSHPLASRDTAFASSRALSSSRTHFIDTGAINRNHKDRGRETDSYLHENVQDLLSLKGRTVVITGGARGIGLALACAVAEAGGGVAVIDALDEPHAHFEQIKRIGPPVRFYRSDVSSYDTLSKTFDDIVRDFGRVDGCITAAAICPDQPFLERKPQDVKKCFDINAIGTFYTAQLAAAQMSRQPKLPSSKSRGSIVMIASTAAHMASKGQFLSDYCSTKGAVLSLAREISVELAEAGVRANCISPGYVKTDLTMDIADTRPGLASIMNNEAPMMRMGDRSEFKGAAVYLLSDASSYTTGGEILITGGLHVGRSH